MTNMRRGQWTFQAVGAGRWIVVDSNRRPVGGPADPLVFEDMKRASDYADVLTEKGR